MATDSDAYVDTQHLLVKYKKATNITIDWIMETWGSRTASPTKHSKGKKIALKYLQAVVADLAAANIKFPMHILYHGKTALECRKKATVTFSLQERIAQGQESERTRSHRFFNEALADILHKLSPVSIPTSMASITDADVSTHTASVKHAFVGQNPYSALENLASELESVAFSQEEGPSVGSQDQWELEEDPMDAVDDALRFFKTLFVIEDLLAGMVHSLKQTSLGQRPWLHTSWLEHALEDNIMIHVQDLIGSHGGNLTDFTNLTVSPFGDMCAKHLAETKRLGYRGERQTSLITSDIADIVASAEGFVTGSTEESICRREDLVNFLPSHMTGLKEIHQLSDDAKVVSFFHSVYQSCLDSVADLYPGPFDDSIAKVEKRLLVYEYIPKFLGETIGNSENGRGLELVVISNAIYQTTKGFVSAQPSNNPILCELPVLNFALEIGHSANRILLSPWGRAIVEGMESATVSSTGGGAPRDSTVGVAQSSELSTRLELLLMASFAGDVSSVKSRLSLLHTLPLLAAHAIHTQYKTLIRPSISLANTGSLLAGFLHMYSLLRQHMPSQFGPVRALDVLCHKWEDMIFPGGDRKSSFGSWVRCHHVALAKPNPKNGEHYPDKYEGGDRIKPDASPFWAYIDGYYYDDKTYREHALGLLKSAYGKDPAFVGRAFSNLKHGKTQIGGEGSIDVHDGVALAALDSSKGSVALVNILNVFHLASTVMYNLGKLAEHMLRTRDEDLKRESWLFALKRICPDHWSGIPQGDDEIARAGPRFMSAVLAQRDLERPKTIKGIRAHRDLLETVLKQLLYLWNKSIVQVKFEAADEKSDADLCRNSSSGTAKRVRHDRAIKIEEEYLFWQSV